MSNICFFEDMIIIFINEKAKEDPQWGKVAKIIKSTNKYGQSSSHKVSVIRCRKFKWNFVIIFTNTTLRAVRI